MADRSAEPGVEALDRVGGVDGSSQLGGELQERSELVPGLAPGSGDRGVGVSPVGGEGLEVRFGVWVPETRPWALTCRDGGRC